MSKRIAPSDAPRLDGTSYPPPFHEHCLARQRSRLGDAAGLTQFGVNLLRLPPGAWSSVRHWESLTDEFVHVLSGEVTLVTDAGEETLRPGDSAGFPAGKPDGHCLQNRSEMDATMLEIGTRLPGNATTYPDADLLAPGNGAGYTHRDGTPYPPYPRRTT